MDIKNLLLYSIGKGTIIRGRKNVYVGKNRFSITFEVENNMLKIVDIKKKLKVLPQGKRLRKQKHILRGIVSVGRHWLNSREDVMQTPLVLKDMFVQTDMPIYENAQTETKAPDCVSANTQTTSGVGESQTAPRDIGISTEYVKTRSRGTCMLHLESSDKASDTEKVVCKDNWTLCRRPQLCDNGVMTEQPPLHDTPTQTTDVLAVSVGTGMKRCTLQNRDQQTQQRPLRPVASQTELNTTLTCGIQTEVHGRSGGCQTEWPRVSIATQQDPDSVNISTQTECSPTDSCSKSTAVDSGEKNSDSQQASNMENEALVYLLNEIGEMIINQNALLHNNSTMLGQISEKASLSEEIIKYKASINRQMAKRLLNSKRILHKSGKRYHYHNFGCPVPSATRFLKQQPICRPVVMNRACAQPMRDLHKSPEQMADTMEQLREPLKQVMEELLQGALGEKVENLVQTKMEEQLKPPQPQEVEKKPPEQKQNTNSCICVTKSSGKDPPKKTLSLRKLNKIFHRLPN